MSRAPTSSKRLERQLADEGGFTLIELVIAVGVMAMVLASLAYAGTVAFADAALARNRQVASNLANQAIEQARALPFDTLALGLSTSDLQSDADPAVTDEGGGVYRFDGERIPHGNNAAVAPLVPHRVTQTIDNVMYEVAVYVTYLDDDVTSSSYRLTAIASWASDLRPGTQKFVQVQTIVACASTFNSATHPFCAPVQPFLYATSDVTDGGITFTAYGSGAAVAGLDLERASLWLPTESSSMQIEQISAVTASGRTSGATMKPTGGSESEVGRQIVTVGADTDPAQKPPYATDSVGTGSTSQSSSTLSLNGSSNSFSLVSSGGDTATVTATVDSTVTNLCTDVDVTPLVDNQPCGNGTATQGGGMQATLSLGTLGTVTLASMAAPGADNIAHTNRDVAPQPGSCPATEGDGCIHASHSASVGAVRIGALPSSLAALAPGFDYLLKIDGYNRTVRAEAGVGAADPSVTNRSGGSDQGTIQYWNGSGYTSLTIGAGASTSISIPALTVSDGLTSTTLEIVSIVRTGGTTSPACASPCAESFAQAESPVVGDIRYRVIVAGETIVDLNIHIDFGTLTASARYTPGV
ncbi:MAG TPA: type II secretion system protein [Acidimicrobiales bacterium]|nr:type II secretion system protein [Acidimicrobiales bacterium]